MRGAGRGGPPELDSRLLDGSEARAEPLAKAVAGDIAASPPYRQVFRERRRGTGLMNAAPVSGCDGRAGNQGTARGVAGASAGPLDVSARGGDPREDRCRSPASATESAGGRVGRGRARGASGGGARPPRPCRRVSPIGRSDQADPAESRGGRVPGGGGETGRSLNAPPGSSLPAGWGLSSMVKPLDLAGAGCGRFAQRPSSPHPRPGSVTA